MSVTKKVRFEVFKRDKFTCQYCGKSAPDVALQADHINPRANGGTDDLLNLITSCFDCNQGKKARLLSDDTVIKKRKRQLDELQNRREQLEMLMEWQKGLMKLDDEVLAEAHAFWKQLVPGYQLTEQSLVELSKLIRKHGVMEIIETMRVSVDQYIRYPKVDDGDTNRPTKESADKAFTYIPRILANKKRFADKPHLKDLYYIRAILKNRLNYVNDHKAIEYLEMAFDADVSIANLTDIAKQVKSWTAFVNAINEAVSGGKDEE